MFFNCGRVYPCHKIFQIPENIKYLNWNKIKKWISSNEEFKTVGVKQSDEWFIELQKNIDSTFNRFKIKELI